MCMQDYAMMKYSQANVRKFVMSTSAGLALPSNPARIAIMWPSFVTNEVYVMNSPTSGEGITIRPNLAPQIWTLRDLGMAITWDWYLQVSAGSVGVYITEINLNVPMEQIIEEWQRLTLREAN